MEFDDSRLAPALAMLSKPAKRALIQQGICSEKDLAQRRRSEIAKLHGIGPASFPVLEDALKAAGLRFKPE